MPVLKAPVKTATTATSTTTGAAKPSFSTTQKKVDPFAARYAATDPSTGGGYVPPPVGSWNGLITAAEAVQDGEKTSAYIEATLVDDEVSGKATRIYFNFTDENGTDMPGMPYFKQAMEMLGHPEPLESWTHMEQVLAEIVAEQPWVIIKVWKKGKYTNTGIEAVPENQNEKPSL